MAKRAVIVSDEPEVYQEIELDDVLEQEEPAYTIFDKYAEQISAVENEEEIVLGWKEAMEIVWYVSKQVGHAIGYSHSCKECRVELVKKLISYRDNG